MNEKLKSELTKTEPRVIANEERISTKQNNSHKIYKTFMCKIIEVSCAIPK